MTPPQVRPSARYGWLPDLPSAKDLWYPANTASMEKPEGFALPASHDMRALVPIIFDQGNLGSCTANANAGAVMFELKKQGVDPSYTPSRLMIYYDERVIEDSVSTDAGAMIRDGMRTLHYRGACDETQWPYDVSKFANSPPASCYTDGQKYLVERYLRIDNTNLTAMKECLATGFPFVSGFTVYDSFESDAVTVSGVVPMPAPTEQVLGGHAVLTVGYDDLSQRFVCANSWGTAWGQKGFFTIPYEYWTNANLADDFWTIRLVA